MPQGLRMHWHSEWLERMSYEADLGLLQGRDRSLQAPSRITCPDTPQLPFLWANFYHANG